MEVVLYLHVMATHDRCSGVSEVKHDVVILILAIDCEQS